MLSVFPSQSVSAYFLCSASPVKGRRDRNGNVTHLVECLPSMFGALGSILAKQTKHSSASLWCWLVLRKERFKPAWDLWSSEASLPEAEEGGERCSHLTSYSGSGIPESHSWRIDHSWRPPSPSSAWPSPLSVVKDQHKYLQHHLVLSLYGLPKPHPRPRFWTSQSMGSWIQI